jgi:putative colanic acid biosysnthesis UDP-glucose lipid carrier transferase
MQNRFKNKIINMMLLLDLMFVNGCFALTYWIHYQFAQFAFTPEFVGFFVYINLLWIIVSRLFHIYRSIRFERALKMLFINFAAIVVFFFLFLLYFQLITFNYLDRDELKYYFVVFFFLVMVTKAVMRFILPFLNRLLNHRRVAIIVGYNSNARELSNFFDNDTWSDYHFKGFFADTKLKHEPFLGTYNNLKSYLESNRVDDIFLLLSTIPMDLKHQIVEIANNQSTNIHLVPDLSYFNSMNVSCFTYGNIPVLQLQRSPLNQHHNIIIKRIFDLIVSAIVIIGLLSWLTPLIWLANRLLYKTGVFYKQWRNGLNNKPFRCYKYKSMYDNDIADKNTALQNDPRTTSLGKFLRKTSIDELPQVLNVFLGQMSIVGPRPHMLKHTNEYRKALNHFMVRHIVKPGMTGLAQVNGFRGGIFDDVHLMNRVKMDIRYIENWTFWMDIKTILLTMLTLVKGEKNAY